MSDSVTLAYGDRAIEQAAQEPFERWPNPSENAYTIHLEHPEFTALYPRSGYPDFGTIVVDYQPGPWVVELKAFKLYINSFRNQRISHEGVVNVVAIASGRSSLRWGCALLATSLGAAASKPSSPCAKATADCLSATKPTSFE